MSSAHDKSLCTKCESIDLEKVFAGGYTTPHLVAELGPLEHLKRASQCPLCRLIVDAVFAPFGEPSLASYHESCGRCDSSQSHGSEGQDNYYLFAVCISGGAAHKVIGHSDYFNYQNVRVPLAFEKSLNFLKADQSRSVSTTGAEDNIIEKTTIQNATGRFYALQVGRLSSVESQFIAFYGTILPAFATDSVCAPARLLRSTTVSWNVVKSWLDDCLSNHVACKTRAAVRSVKHLRVINCRTCQLEHADEETCYVALSYVWGKSEKTSIDNVDSTVGATIENMPLVVADAMEVVRRLGYGFIWVDRYCVPQHDAGELEEHLSRMHSIYHNADLTIVAAAGNDSTYGLPGVSTTARALQSSTEIEGRLYVSGLESFTASERQSRWNSRAWTYQEGVFSQRRLLFGSQQVHFHCKTDERDEMYHLATDVSRSSQSDLVLQARSIWEHISYYSQRSLTYASDALNAMLGVLSAFQDASGDQFGHVWGIPFATDLRFLDRSGSNVSSSLQNARFPSINSLFGYSLTWRLSSSTPAGQRTLQRREEFPTWSWASCIGTINFMILPWATQDSPTMPDPEIDVCMQHVDGSLISLSDHLTSTRQLRLSKYLHIEAWCCESVTFMPEDGIVKMSVSDDFELRGNIGLDSFRDTRDQATTVHKWKDTDESTRQWECMIVSYQPSDWHGAEKPFILILMKVEGVIVTGSPVYERTGHITNIQLSKKHKPIGQRQPYMLQTTSNGNDSNDDSATDSDDYGDFTINTIAHRANVAQYFPRLPKRRRRLVLC